MDVKTSRRYSVRRKINGFSQRWLEKPTGDGRTNTQRKFKVLLKTPTAKERQDWSRDFRSKFLGDFGNDRDSYGIHRDSYGYDRDTKENRRSFHDRNYDKRRSFYDDK